MRVYVQTTVSQQRMKSRVRFWGKGHKRLKQNQIKFWQILLHMSLLPFCQFIQCAHLVQMSVYDFMT